MSRRSDIPFLTAFGVTFWMVGAWILSKPFLELPTKTPPTVLHLSGLPQVLFAGGPILGGLALGLAAWRVYRGGELGPGEVTLQETVAFLAGVASLIAGLLSGTRI